jgi:hypothetical protein
MRHRKPAGAGARDAGGGRRGAAQPQVRHRRKDLGPNRGPPQKMERSRRRLRLERTTGAGSQL